jgi:hypothetical protein
MVNLLPQTPSPGRAGVRFEAAQARRIAARLGPLLALHRNHRLAALETALEALVPELEELASAPHRVAALALLEAIDALRVDAARGLPGEAHALPDGARSTPGSNAARSDPGSIAFVCHRPGRSLATGEAEIASRGYFDVEDRPPLACWLGLLPLPSSTREGEADFVIVAWVADEDRARAQAGCHACGSGALEGLDDFAPTAAAQLRACVAAVASD